MIQTERDYVEVNSDPNAFFMQVVDAVTGEPIEGVTEANAVDGWFYQVRKDGDGKTIQERFVDHRGLSASRTVHFRVEQAIAITFKDEAPASLRNQDHRLQPK